MPHEYLLGVREGAREARGFFGTRGSCRSYLAPVSARYAQQEVRCGKLEDGEAASMNAGTRPRSSPYWLTIGYETYGMEVLTIESPGTAEFPDGQKALPLFSSREDAEEFLELVRKEELPHARCPVMIAGGRWRIRETTRGELVSLLCGACADVGTVLLDPLPQISVGLAIELVGLSRESFVDRLLGRGRPWFDDRRRSKKEQHEEEER